jgi:hypothetical protein
MYCNKKYKDKFNMNFDKWYEKKLAVYKANMAEQRKKHPAKVLAKLCGVSEFSIMHIINKTQKPSPQLMILINKVIKDIK